MKAKIISLLLIASCAQGMAPETEAIQKDPAEEKLLVEEPVVIIEGSTLEWDAMSALVRPEFKQIVEQEYSAQDLAAACRALQAATSGGNSVHQNFMKYVQLNGSSAARNYGSVERAFEDELVGHLNGVTIQAGLANQRRIADAQQECDVYHKSRFYWWRHQCVGLGVMFPIAAFVMGVCWAFQNEHTCLL